MTHDARQLDGAGQFLELTVSSDGGHENLVRDLAQRFARYIGYSDEEASVIAGAVQRTVTGTIVHAREAHEVKDVTISLLGGETALEIAVRYRGGEPDPPAGGLQLCLDQSLDQSKEGESPLQLIRRVMRRVEFGHDTDEAFCHLTCHSPASS